MTTSIGNRQSAIGNSSWLWTRKAFEPCASVPLSDRGFRYGMAFFESLRVENSAPQFLAEHLQRLRDACVAHGFPIAEEALESVNALLRGAGFDGFARIYVTAGDGGPDEAIRESRCFVFLNARERPSVAAYDLEICDAPHQPLFGGLKTANYWANIDALQTARQHGGHEALLFNPNGELISACMANVFVVHGGEVKTPALECGARAGVWREHIMQRINVHECSLFHEHVMTADEIFLTNSWLGVMPCRSMEGRELNLPRIFNQIGG